MEEGVKIGNGLLWWFVNLVIVVVGWSDYNFSFVGLWIIFYYRMLLVIYFLWYLWYIIKDIFFLYSLIIYCGCF